MSPLCYDNARDELDMSSYNDFNLVPSKFEIPFPTAPSTDDRPEEEPYTISAYGISNDDIFTTGKMTYLEIRRPRKARKHIKVWPDAKDKAALEGVSERLSTPSTPTTPSAPTTPTTPSSSAADTALSPKGVPNATVKSQVPSSPWAKRLIFGESTNTAVSETISVDSMEYNDDVKENIPPPCRARASSLRKTAGIQKRKLLRTRKISL